MLVRARLGLEDRDTGPRATWSDGRSVAPALVQVNCYGESNASRVSQSSTSSEKVALFRPLFVGRDDVYARAWSSQRTGKAGWSPAVLRGVANAKSPDREYLPYTEDVVEWHLAGELHVAIYQSPLPSSTNWSTARGPGNGTGRPHATADHSRYPTG